ncbi:MAG: hypothetical protein KDA20_12870 [Phycisphaerales bacterium]|nr:hypothetical protein [Phycisphaerales bacterium]
MKVWGGAVATTIAVAISSQAFAGVMQGPGHRPAAIDPFGDEPVFAASPMRSIQILPAPEPGTQAFESLGVMTLLEPPALWPTSTEDTVPLDIAALAAQAGPNMRFERLDLPSTLAQLNEAKSGNAGIFDVIFVIPAPGSVGALAMLGLCTVPRRRSTR